MDSDSVANDTAPECHHCGSTAFEVDSIRGDTVCTNCGHVAEESQIVSEITFTENGNNTHSVVGQFVPESGVRNSTRRPGMGTFSRDNREITITNGNRRISDMLSKMNLSRSQIMESAQRFFRLAVQQNFIQGRKTEHVIAACTYISCRKERTPHMLIDFCDFLQISVYELGHVYLRLKELLKLKIPMVDPSLYMHKFSEKLEFGHKSYSVSQTALRLVSRMERDWIQSGRRPAGICGSALFIAAKMHGFNRTVKEIIHVVRVCDLTIRKRLSEFELTSSSGLTISEFQDQDDAEALDEERFKPRGPPSFLALRKAQKESSMMTIATSVIAKSRGASGTSSSTAVGGEGNDTVRTNVTDSDVAAAQALAKDLSVSDMEEDEEEDQERNDENSDDDNEPLGAARTTHPAKVSPSGSAAAEGGTAPTTNSVNKYQNFPTSEDNEIFVPMDGLDTDEIDDYIVSEQEATYRRLQWEEINKEYLEKKAERERMKEEQSSATKKTPKRKAREPRTTGINVTSAAAASAKKKQMTQTASSLNYAAFKALPGSEKFFDSTKTAATGNAEIDDTDTQLSAAATAPQNNE